VQEAAREIEKKRKELGSNVGLYIETKRPAWHRSIGLPLEEKIISDIQASGFSGTLSCSLFLLSLLSLFLLFLVPFLIPLSLSYKRKELVVKANKLENILFDKFSVWFWVQLLEGRKKAKKGNKTNKLIGPIIIQSFEEGSLRLLKELKPDWPRVRLAIDLKTAASYGVASSEALPYLFSFHFPGFPGEFSYYSSSSYSSRSP
jgi:hypothetical protein